MHVFGAPAAVGAAAAIATSAMLNPDAGLGLGALLAGIGSMLAGYYITAGFDRKLVVQLQSEAQQQQQAVEAQDIQQALSSADAALQPRLQSILQYHAAIEAEFADGIDDQVESILQSSRDDLTALRDRAISLVKLQGRLKSIVEQTDGQKLYQQIKQLATKIERTAEGSARDALQAALESTGRTHEQWRAAIDKQEQIASVLTIIETNLQQFKLAMELRKADAAMGSAEAGPDVSDLQARLIAAGQACDELAGRSSSTSVARRTRKQASKVR